MVAYYTVLFSLSTLLIMAQSGSCSVGNNTICPIRLQSPVEEQRQFANIDQKQVWIIHIRFMNASDNATNIGNEQLSVIWTLHLSNPFLSFNPHFEIYSFTMLSDSVLMMKIALHWKQDDCFKTLTGESYQSSVAEILLRNVTNKQGAICFGTTVSGITTWDVTPSPSCCEWKGAGLKCGIAPVSRWAWAISSDKLEYFFFTAIFITIFLLLCLLPSPPEPVDGHEVTQPGAPSPLSFTNVFVKCYNNQKLCFREKFKKFCSRFFVFGILTPLPLYLLWIMKKVITTKLGAPLPLGVFIVTKIRYSLAFFNSFLILYVVFIICSVFSPLFGFHSTLVTRMQLEEDSEFISELTVIASKGDLATSLRKVYKKCFRELSSSFQRKIFFYSKGSCKNKTELLKGIGLCIICVIFYPIAVIIMSVVGVPIIGFFVVTIRMSYIGRESCNYLLPRKTFFFIYWMSTWCGASFMLLTSISVLILFLEYTIIGFVVNYKNHLPILIYIFAAFSYTYGFYRATNEPYKKLRKLLFDVCIKLQNQNSEAKLVFKSENGTKVIPKKLFRDVCSEFKPILETFLIMVFKISILLLFLLFVLVAALTLTPRNEFGVITQSSITVFVAGVPYLFSIVSNDSADEELCKLDLESRLEKFVESFELNDFELSQSLPNLSDPSLSTNLELIAPNV